MGIYRTASRDRSIGCRSLGRKSAKVIPAGYLAHTIAKVWPQSVQRPVIGGQQLTFGLETSVCRPELGGEEESSVGLSATRIDGTGVGGAGARQDGVGVGCEYTALAGPHCRRIGPEYALN